MSRAREGARAGEGGPASRRRGSRAQADGGAGARGADERAEAPHAFRRRSILRHRPEGPSEVLDAVAVEAPLEIRLGREPIAVTMRTPGHDAELAAGYCLGEGIVAHGDELESVEVFARGAGAAVAVVRLTEPLAAGRVAELRRGAPVVSACGICGRGALDQVDRPLGVVRGPFRVGRRTLAALPGRMREAQAAFAATGGLHAAALFTPAGELVALREDIGRHNAVDKVVGARALLGALPIDPGVLLVSGRASFEVVQKAGAAGIAMVSAVGAVSSLAVDLAERLGVTLIGFLRDGGWNVYTGRGRVDMP